MRNKRSNLPIHTFLSACILSVVISVCHASGDPDYTSGDPDDEGDPITKNDVQGIWEQTGYGQLLHIDNEEARIFEFTRASCLQTEVLDSDDLDEFIETITLSNNKRSFKRNLPGEVFAKRFRKRAVLPEFCEPDKLIDESTPTIVFNHLWHNFNDYYAFFKKRGIDWAAQGAEYQLQVHDNMTDEQLFILLAEMLDPLDDDHVELAADTDELEAEFSPAHDTFVFMNELSDAFEHQSDFDNIDEYIEFNIARARALPLSSVNDLKQAGVLIESAGAEVPAIYWGTLYGNIAYINITRMIGFDETIKPDDEDFEYDAEKDMQALNVILDEVMDDLKDTRKMIIDVRLNPGGSDFSSIEIANRFATDKLRVISKFARSYRGKTPIQHAYTTPTSDPYTSPVVILSSQETGSAAEIFLMTMNAFHNVSLMGEPSNGRLSDILSKALPNEWSFAMSNEVYSDYRNRRFEVRGVPVDIKAKALSLADIEQDVDTALIKAMVFLWYSDYWWW